MKQLFLIFAVLVLMLSHPIASQMGNFRNYDDSVEYVQWLEPNENAFTIEVPSQWTVTGGVMRWPTGKIGLNSGYKVVIRMASPDRRTLITSGDENIPVYFSIPNQILEMSGFGENSIYGESLVMHYMTGDEYAKWYAENWLTNEYGYTDVRITKSRQLQDKSNELNSINARHGMPSKSDFGEVYFTCKKGNDELVGYYLASTELTSISGSVEIWRAPVLRGYVTPIEESDLARAVLAHIDSSTKPNEQWMLGMINNAGKVREIAEGSIQTGSMISDMIAESYSARERTNDDIQQGWVDYTNDRLNVVDPQNGEVTNVQGYAKYYWKDQKTGKIIPTDTPLSPGMDYILLEEVE